MLGNLTIDDVDFSASCSRAADFFVAFNACVGCDRTKPVDVYSPFQCDNAACDGLPLRVWGLLNATGIDMGNYTMQQVMSWYNDNPPSSIVSMYLGEEGIFAACKKDVCSKFVVKGDPDIGGIGVLTAYCIELTLGALLLVGLFWMTWQGERHPEKGISLTSKVNTKQPIPLALQSALGVFWDSSIFFSLGVSIAGLVATSAGVSQYDGLLMEPSVTIAILVPMVLWGFNARLCSFRLLRRAILSTALILVVLQVSVSWGDIEGGPDPTGIFFMNYCFPTAETPLTSTIFLGIWEYSLFGLAGINTIGAAIKFPWRARWAAPYGPLRCLIEVPRLSLTVEMNPFRVWCKDPKGWLEVLAVVVDLVAFAIPFTQLCLSFYSFVYIRQLINANIQGGLDQQQWGFGQVLAVTAWIPTVLELVSTGKDKLDGYKWRIPAGLRVIIDERDAASSSVISNGDEQNVDDAASCKRVQEMQSLDNSSHGARRAQRSTTL